MTLWLGFTAACFMGAVLGLLGGGGSILTIPILVYLLHVEPVTATSYSLFVVGIAATIAGLRYWQKGQADSRVALRFGGPALAGILLARQILLPSLPEVLWREGTFLLTKGRLILIVFAGLMWLASFSMIRGRKAGPDTELRPLSRRRAMAQGLGIGVLTGFVGAGGGFLIIPALVFLCGLPMKRAVGTSLSILAVNSLFGFLGDLGHIRVDWSLLGGFTTVSVLGIFLGIGLSERISGAGLRKAFGWLVLVTGTGILVKELFF